MSKNSHFLKVLVFACVVYFTATLISSHIEITNKRQELVAVMEQCEDQRIANKETERMLLMYQDPSYLERAAREKLGFGYPDERLFIESSGIK